MGSARRRRDGKASVGPCRRLRQREKGAGGGWGERQGQMREAIFRRIQIKDARQDKRVWDCGLAVLKKG